VRLILWLVVSALFPLSVTGTVLSFKLEVLRVTTPPALPPERHLDLAERVLARLEAAEQKESDLWLRDDIRIAWITVLYASRGNPQPHIDATYQVLGIHPDKVWPAICARRAALLGSLEEACATPVDLSAVLGTEWAAVDAITAPIPPAGTTTRTGTRKSSRTMTTTPYPPRKPCATERREKAA
jgi:hypothetical protein